MSHTVAVGAAFLSWLGSMIVFVRALGVEHLGEHPFESSSQLAADWRYLVQDRRAGGSAHRRGVVLRGMDGLDDLPLQRWLSQLWSAEGDHDHPGLPPHGATVEEHGHKHVVPIGRTDVFALLCLHRFVRLWHVRAGALR